MKKISLLSAALLSIFIFLSSNNASAQQDAGKSEGMWFVNLVRVHNGKEFCVPNSTTFNQLAATLVTFSKAHPELQDRITDPVAIQALAESYPCTGNSVKASPLNLVKPPIGSIREIAPIFSQLLLLSVPATFRPVFEHVGNAGSFYIAESVLAGESTAQWTQMITRTGAKDLAARIDISPQSFAMNLANRFKTVCPTTFSSLDLGVASLDGHDAYAMIASCGNVSSGNISFSESTLIIQIKGSSDYYGIQWAVRGPASLQPLALNAPIWRERLQKLQPIKLCPIIPGEPAPYPSCVH